MRLRTLLQSGTHHVLHMRMRCTPHDYRRCTLCSNTRLLQCASACQKLLNLLQSAQSPLPGQCNRRSATNPALQLSLHWCADCRLVLEVLPRGRRAFKQCCHSSATLHLPSRMAATYMCSCACRISAAERPSVIVSVQRLIIQCIPIGVRLRAMSMHQRPPLCMGQTHQSNEYVVR